MSEDHARSSAVRVAPLLGILLLALAIRLPLAVSHDVAQQDSATYFQLARYISAPEAFDSVPFRIVNPLYSILVSLVLALPVDPALGARLANAVLGSIAAVLAVFLGRRIGGPRIGYLTGVLTACWYMLALDSASVMTEPLFVVISVGNLLLIYRWSDRPERPLGAVLVGATAGLAVLTRGNGLAYAPIALILLFAGWRGFKELAWTRRIVLGAIFLAVFAAFWAAPRVYVASRGEELPDSLIFPFHDGTNIALEDREAVNYRLTEDGTERQFARDVRGRSVVGLMLERPGRMVKKYALNIQETLDHIVPVLFVPITALILPFVFLGIFALFREGRRASLWLIALHSFPWLVLMPLIQVRPRHFYGTLPLWIAAIAAALLVSAKDSVLVRRLKQGFLAFTLLTMIGGAGYVLTVDAATVNDARIAGAWLEENTPPTTRFLCRNSEVAIHAGGRVYDIVPYEGIDRIVSYARLKGIDYLVLDRMVKEFRPQLASLRKGEEVPPDLELAARLDTGPGGPTLIYRIRR